ncbi:MAG: (d)CMP kinase [Solirubrobacterales bacterium]
MDLLLSIAVDGPAGAGKSTIAKIISQKFNLMYINTGAMYRAVALFAVRSNIRSEDIKSIESLIVKLDMHFEGDKLIVNNEDVSEEIVSPEISRIVSEYAAIKEVRLQLAEMQKSMALKYNVIMDGRDIGTVVLKDAFIKFFITASPEERANRRFSELKAKGINVDYEVILKDINDRDYYDTHRKTDPLRMAEDAIILDTSNMNIQQVVETMCKYINDKIEKNSQVVN